MGTGYYSMRPPAVAAAAATAASRGKSRLVRPGDEDGDADGIDSPSGWLKTIEPVIYSLDHHSNIVAFQRICGLQKVREEDVRPEEDGHLSRCCSSGTAYRVTRPWVHNFFQVARYGGEELLFLLLFPIIIWCIDTYTLRRVSWMFSCSMYVTTAGKDLVCKSRPACPPVLRLEARSAQEYSMPSTHAVAATAITVSVLDHYWTRHMHAYPPATWYLLAGFTAAYILAVSASRIYNGMHSFLDVLCGVGCTWLLMTSVLARVDLYIEPFVCAHPSAPCVLFLVGLLLSLAYPKTECWNTGRGDSITLVGSHVGYLIGCWINFVLLAHPYDVISISEPDAGFTLAGVLAGACRLLVGLPLVFIIRLACRYCLLRILCDIAGLDSQDPASKQVVMIETLYKYLSYVILGVCGVVVVPQVFALLAI
jgi:membrane-associated phospholipid phosphatase